MGGGSLVEGQGGPTPGALEFFHVHVWGEDRWWKFIGSKVSLASDRLGSPAGLGRLYAAPRQEYKL